MPTKRIPPAIFGFDRVDPPQGGNQRAHREAMRWFVDNTNLRIAGGYLGHAVWQKYLPEDWEAGWGIAVFVIHHGPFHVPSGNEWGEYSFTFPGQRPITHSDPPHELQDVQGTVQDPNHGIPQMKHLMKQLFSDIHRPVLFLDNEDASPTTIAPGARGSTTIDQGGLIRQVIGPGGQTQEELTHPGGVAVANISPVFPRRPGETDVDLLKRALAGGLSVVRGFHGANDAIPWLRAAIQELEKPDPDGFAVRAAVYGHANLLTQLIGEVPWLLLCEPNYGANHGTKRPDGTIIDAKPISDITCTRDNGSQFAFFPDTRERFNDDNVLPKPQSDRNALEARTSGGTTFTIWSAMVQWCGDCVLSGGLPRNPVRPVISEMGWDFQSSLLEDPLTGTPGPRFAVDSDAFLWRLTRVPPPANFNVQLLGSPPIAELTCVELGAQSPPLQLTNFGTRIVVPSMAPIPLKVGNRTFVILAERYPGGQGVALILVERTAQGLQAPVTAVRANGSVFVGAPMGVGPGGGTNVYAAAMGRDSQIKVAQFDIQNLGAATWQDTGLMCHPLSRLAVRTWDQNTGLIVVHPGGTPGTPAIAQWGRWQPTALPWPPTYLQLWLTSGQGERIIPTSALAVGGRPRNVGGAGVHLLWVGSDLRVYCRQEITTNGWSAPVQLSTDIICPYSAMVVAEPPNSNNIEILLLLQDLQIVLYRVNGGRVVERIPWVNPFPQGRDKADAAPNPFGDLGLTLLGQDRILAIHKLAAQQTPRALPNPLPTRFGTVSYLRQSAAAQPPANLWGGWQDIP